MRRQRRWIRAPAIVTATVLWSVVGVGFAQERQRLEPQMQSAEEQRRLAKEAQYLSIATNSPADGACRNLSSPQYGLPAISGAAVRREKMR